MTSTRSHIARVLDARTRALALLDELDQLDPERRPLIAQARALVLEATNRTIDRLERSHQ